MNFFKKLFKKKPNPNMIGLEKAKQDNLITEEEFLQLKSERAKMELSNYLKNKKLKK